MNLADRIQSLRKTKGISQEELADNIGVSRQAVSKWESEQSTPDLDKVIIMSEYFDVTTDYILRGIEPVKNSEDRGNVIASKILYLASTALIIIGLLCAFASWYIDQSAESIWGSMIIQVVGVIGYFIGKVISKAKAHVLINWLNIVLLLFMPICLIITLIINSVAVPYPTDVLSGLVFAGVYIAIILLTFFVLKKLEKKA
jgi:transcriptional regulator with XRE-family HTH domain